jgi:hypothetical protein
MKRTKKRGDQCYAVGEKRIRQKSGQNAKEINNRGGEPGFGCGVVYRWSKNKKGLLAIFGTP